MKNLPKETDSLYKGTSQSEEAPSNDIQEDAGDNVEKEPKRQKTTQVKPMVRHRK